MLNLHKKLIVISCDLILKTYVEYVSRQEHTKAGRYILWDEYIYDKNSPVSIDHVNIEDINNEQNFNTKQYYMD